MAWLQVRILSVAPVYASMMEFRFTADCPNLVKEMDLKSIGVHTLRVRSPHLPHTLKGGNYKDKHRSEVDFNKVDEPPKNHQVG